MVDAELMEFTVDPGERGSGHGSRLLQAAVDTMTADRFRRAVLWAMATDDAMRGFLTSAGWAPDTAHRELDLDGTGATTVKQVRLHTVIGGLDFLAAVTMTPPMGLDMGPLPALYRLLIAALVLLLGLGVGIWLAQ